MSNGKDSLLQHLDRYLVKIHDKGIKYLSIGSGILALHMVVTKIIFTTPKSRALPEWRETNAYNRHLVQPYPSEKA